MKLRRQVVLVYSMGKVGSSSVFFSLKKHVPPGKLFHVHFLSDKWLNIGSSTAKKQSLAPKSVFQSKKYRCKFITLLRDPVGRDISTIFQNYDSLFGVKNADELDADKCMKWLNKQDHRYPERWFDTEFKEFLGIDILKEKFDPNQPYAIYNYESMDILVLKLENLEVSFSNAMREFLEIDIELKSQNVSKDKPGYPIYQSLKSYYKLDPDRLSSVYDNDFITHFYNPKEIETFKDTWT